MAPKRPTRRTVFIAGLASGTGAQVISVVVGLMSVPIGLGYLGPLKYGLWMVISSIMAYLGLSQLGTGTASTTMIAGQTERQNQGLILRSTFRLLCYFAMVLIALAGMAAMFPNTWALLFGDIPDAVKIEAVSAAVAMTVLYFLRLPAAAFTAAYIGLQEVPLERLYVVVLPSLFSFLALLLTRHWMGDLVMLACLTGGAQLLAGLLAALHFSFRHRDMMYAKADHAAEVALTRDLLANGSRFFFIGIAAIIVWHTDNLVISYFLGPENVTAYAVTFKLFATAFSIFVLATSVLMPMLGSAVGRNDWVWIAATYKNMLSVMVMLGGLVWIGGIVFAGPIIHIWTGRAGYGGDLVVFALGGYGYVLSAVNLHANTLSAMNATRAMLWIGITEAVVNLALSILFVHWLGIGGVALGTFLSALVTVYWLLPKDIERQTESRVKACWPHIMRHFWLIVFPAIGVAYFVSQAMQGVGAWVAGAALCAIYLVLSWLLLPKQAQAMLMRTNAADSIPARNGRV